VQVIVIETAALGDRSYVVAQDGVAVVVDPQRDIDRVLAAVPSGASIAYVLETHVHNDYVSGGLELARRTGGQYVIAAADDVAFPRTPVRDGEVLTAGSLSITALHTPGHTPQHLSYLVVDGDGDGDGDGAVFTGGSLLYGTVGRTDLIGAEQTEELTGAQYRSVRRLADTLPASTSVHPTHGFGSFCASAGSAGDTAESTIGHQRGQNLACTTADEQTFVRTMLGGLTAYPAYYAHMAPINRAGPAPLDLAPPFEVAVAQLGKRAAAGAWVVDVRQRRLFAESHVAGTVNVELGDSLPTYLGWVLPWGTPVVLAGDHAGDVEEAQRMLALIGIDHPEARAVGVSATAEATASYPMTDFAELAQVRMQRQLTVLDVRRDDEWRDGHIAGAVHVPLPELDDRLDELPGEPLWVHCASGFRAAIAASLLDRAGRDVVLVDDEFTRAAAAGLELTS
jgi:glyoxylase-like metal-dependent hydrolase (beta-lactamase superfamily II)/rhodanese-related sulfurtransferase